MYKQLFDDWRWWIWGICNHACSESTFQQQSRHKGQWWFAAVWIRVLFSVGVSVFGGCTAVWVSSRNYACVLMCLLWLHVFAVNTRSADKTAPSQWGQMTERAWILTRTGTKIVKVYMLMLFVKKKKKKTYKYHLSSLSKGQWSSLQYFVIFYFRRWHYKTLVSSYWFSL